MPVGFCRTGEGPSEIKVSLLLHGANFQLVAYLGAQGIGQFQVRI